MFKIINKAFLVVVVLFLAKIFLQESSDKFNYKSWPTTSAHLISAEVAVGKRKRGLRYFVVQTTYDFTVNDKLYSSAITHLGVPRFDTEQEALQHLQELTARPAFIVRYHPSTPEKNTLVH